MSSKEIALSAVVCRREDLAAQDLDDEVVMADIQSGRFYGLGESAKRVWELLGTPQSCDALCGSLMEEYAVERDVCERDVREFLGELYGAGLIRVESPSL
jgi:hypothetical protein